MKLTTITALFALLILSSCDPFHKGEGATVVYEDLFPVTTEESWWEYSDDDGNRFSVAIVDVVNDDGEMYYQAKFTETKLNASEVHWFRKQDNELSYSPSLSDDFKLFLPDAYHSEDGRFYLGTNEISYDLYGTYSIGTSRFEDVVELHYSKPILHGFTRITFADNVGPIRLIDDSGRWAVTYDLDSMSLNGTITRYSEE